MVVEGKRCTISATDLELSIITNFETNIENEGSITVPAKAILNFAQYNSDEEVLLETSEGTQLSCKSKHAKTIISGEAATEYPTISPIEREEVFSIQTRPLIEALHMVTFASAKSTLRPVLSGVYLRAEKEKLIFVATDSYRLSEYSIPVSGGVKDISCIIPARVLEELKAVLGSRKEDCGKGEKKKKEAEKAEEGKIPSEVEIVLSSQQIELSIGNTQLLSRLIEVKFPDYQQIIPKDSKTEVTLPTKELLMVVRRMHYFAKEMNNNLTIHLKKSNVHIATPQTQAGKDEATLDATIKGGENKIALSSSYLLDFLSHVDDDEVKMSITDSMHPALFHLPSVESSLHLIMPLRLQEE